MRVPVCVCVCVCARARALRIVSTDTILRFINTAIIIIIIIIRPVKTEEARGCVKLTAVRDNTYFTSVLICPFNTLIVRDTR